MITIVRHEIKNSENWLENTKGASYNTLQTCRKYCRIYNRLRQSSSGINIQKYRPAKDGKYHAR